MKSLALVALVLAAAAEPNAVTVVPRPAEGAYKARAEVASRLAEKQADMAACTDKKLPFMAASLQRVDFSATVRDDGSLALPSVTMSTLGHSGVEACLLGIVKSLHFSFGRSELRISLPVAVNMPVPADGRRRRHGEARAACEAQTADVQAVIGGADFSHCAKKLGYAVQLKLSVEPDGSVGKTEVRADAQMPRDANIDACLTETARRLRFPDRTNGGAVYVPIDFSETSSGPASRQVASRRPEGCRSFQRF